MVSYLAMGIQLRCPACGSIRLYYSITAVRYQCKDCNSVFTDTSLTVYKAKPLPTVETLVTLIEAQKLTLEYNRLFKEIVRTLCDTIKLYSEDETIPDNVIKWLIDALIDVGTSTYKDEELPQFLAKIRSTTFTKVNDSDQVEIKEPNETSPQDSIVFLDPDIGNFLHISPDTTADTVDAYKKHTETCSICRLIDYSEKHIASGGSGKTITFPILKNCKQLLNIANP